MIRRRIAVVTTSYPRDVGDAAGHFVSAEVNRLACDGHDVHVICPGTERDLKIPAPPGVTIHAAGGGSAFGWPGLASRLREAPWRGLQIPAYLLATRRILQELGALDEIIAHWLLPSAWLCAEALPKTPLKAVAHGGDVRALCALPLSLRCWALRRLLTSPISFQFVAESLRQQLLSPLPIHLAEQLRIRSEIRPARLDLTPISAGLQHQVRRRWRKAERPLVVIVGRLVVSKRIALALKAAALMPAPPTVVVIGSGPERRRLEADAKQLGLDSEFSGQLPRKQTLALLAEADLLLHPSCKEGAPTVVREARALGTPVVACQAGDLARWAERDDHLIIVTASASALATAGAKLLGQGRRPFDSQARPIGSS